MRPKVIKPCGCCGKKPLKAPELEPPKTEPGRGKRRKTAVVDPVPDGDPAMTADIGSQDAVDVGSSE